jgi:hypothetical protein
MMASRDVAWVDWSLGDLADVARTTADLIGATEDVDSIVIRKSVGEVPHLLVTVPDEGGVIRSHHQMNLCGCDVQFIGRPDTRRWSAEVAGVWLTVETDRGSA